MAMYLGKKRNLPVSTTIIGIVIQPRLEEIHDDFTCSLVNVTLRNTIPGNRNNLKCVIFSEVPIDPRENESLALPSTISSQNITIEFNLTKYFCIKFYNSYEVEPGFANDSNCDSIFQFPHSCTNGIQNQIKISFRPLSLNAQLIYSSDTNESNIYKLIEKWRNSGYNLTYVWINHFNESCKLLSKIMISPCETRTSVISHTITKILNSIHSKNTSTSHTMTNILNSSDPESTFIISHSIANIINSTESLSPESVVSKRLKREAMSNHGLSKYFDSLIDLLIIYVKNILKQRGGRIMMPNISERISGSWLKYTIQAQDGWLQGVDSLLRIKPSNVTKKENSYIITSELHFDSLKFGYDHIQTSLFFWKLTARLEGVVEQTGMLISSNVTLFNHRKCHLTLENLTLTELNGTIVRITGLGIFNKMASKISSWAVRRFKTQVMKVVANYVKIDMQDTWKHLPCGKYFTTILQNAPN